MTPSRHQIPKLTIPTTKSLLNKTQHEYQIHTDILPIDPSNCKTVTQLRTTHAHILRTNFLHQTTSPFHHNNLIRAYTYLNEPHKASHVYILMSRANIHPDTYTIPILLKATCQAFDVNMGIQLHGVAIKHALDRNQFCESGFINLYCKAGLFRDARKLFDGNCERKLGSWNAIIAGFSQGGHCKEAVRMFLGMKKSGFCPDCVSMVSVMSACGSLGDLRLASQLHKCVFAVGDSVLMMNSVVDMYGKCGRMDLAYEVFSRMEVRNVSSWTSMIVGYGMHGHVDEAIECFRGMREEGIEANHVTFVGVLSACVHGGMVKEGRCYFNMMRDVYGIMPRLPHYGCMVDLLGRAGLLEDARKMVEGMPMKANSVVWGCLMGACEKYGNVEMGEWVAEHLQELEPWNDGAYVVLSNIYACRGLWSEVERIRGIMKHRRLEKIPGYSLSTSAEQFLSV